MPPSFIESLQMGFMSFCLVFFPVLAAVLVLSIFAFIINNDYRFENWFFKKANKNSNKN